MATTARDLKRYPLGSGTSGTDPVHSTPQAHRCRVTPAPRARGRIRAKNRSQARTRAQGRRGGQPSRSAAAQAASGRQEHPCRAPWPAAAARQRRGRERRTGSRSGSEGRRWASSWTKSLQKENAALATARVDDARPVVGTWAKLAVANEDAVGGDVRRVRGGCAERGACSAREAHAAALVRSRACARAARGGVARTGVASSVPVPLRNSGLAVVDDRGRVRCHCLHPAIERLSARGWRWCECDGIERSVEERAGRGRCMGEEKENQRRADGVRDGGGAGTCGDRLALVEGSPQA